MCLVGFMCERWDLPRGFSGKGARHKIGSKGYGILQGFFRKSVIFFPGFETEQGGAVRRQPWWTMAPALRAMRSSTKRRNRERRSGRYPRSAHLGWGRAVGGARRRRRSGTPPATESGGIHSARRVDASDVVGLLGRTSSRRITAAAGADSKPRRRRCTRRSTVRRRGLETQGGG
jgi:hypothetical protein